MKENDEVTLVSWLLQKHKIHKQRTNLFLVLNYGLGTKRYILLQIVMTDTFWKTVSKLL
jgi:hypothetical protein